MFMRCALYASEPFHRLLVAALASTQKIVCTRMQSRGVCDFLYSCSVEYATTVALCMILAFRARKAW